MEMFTEIIMHHFEISSVIKSEFGNTLICGSLFTGTLYGSIHAIYYYNEFDPWLGAIRNYESHEFVRDHCLWVLYTKKSNIF